jgi:hypothetical protein
MLEFTIQWWLAALFGVAFGVIVSFCKGKYKANKDMVNCTNERLDKMERILKAMLRKDINDIFNKYKTKKKMPDSEMEYAEAIYQEYKEYDPNGIMKTRMETMRGWSANEEKD